MEVKLSSVILTYCIRTPYHGYKGFLDAEDSFAHKGFSTNSYIISQPHGVTPGILCKVLFWVLKAMQDLDIDSKTMQRVFSWNP